MKEGARLNEEVFAYKLERRARLRGLSWEDKVALIVRMRDSLDRTQWKRPSKSSIGWSEKESSETTRLEGP